MGKTLVYPKRPSSTVNRHKERATYDLGPIHAIVNSSPVLHVSFNPGGDDPFPTTLPMIGQMGSFEYPSAGIDEPLDCYIHGYVSSRMMNLARASEKGLPVCIAATNVDGYILTLTPFSHSYNYRSVVLHGYAQPVTDEEEKLYAMKLITNSVVPSRWENTRNPPDGGEMASTTILRVKIVDGSGKVRNGGVSDERQDLERPELVDKVWTGVVPIWQTFGEPIPSPYNKVPVPEHISSYIKEMNEKNERYAKEAIHARPPKEAQN
ncbi:hypothetical protein VTO42DRAFT_1550 [Malbranchea cinnamomea]